MLSYEQQVESAYAICKWQAATDGAFPDDLTKHWFEAAWQKCAEMVGLIFPPLEVKEPIRLDRWGRFWLTHRPSSEVKIFAGYTLIAILPPSLQRSHCDPSLCCHCNLMAHYLVGSTDPCHVITPSFVQAVARLFTYLVENRGDVPMDDDVLSKCGAMTFLADQATFVV